MRFFTSVFFHESNRFHGQKYAENCGNEALKLQTSEKISITELHFFKKLRDYDCGSPSFKLRNYDCRLKKKVARANLCSSVDSSVIVFHS
jgi:hypothetical protein